jgi:hypothetical protein
MYGVPSSMAAMSAPTITQSMLDLRSARRSGFGNCVMVGVMMMRSWTDLGPILAVDRDSEWR